MNVCHLHAREHYSTISNVKHFAFPFYLDFIIFQFFGLGQENHFKFDASLMYIFESLNHTYFSIKHSSLIYLLGN